MRLATIALLLAACTQTGTLGVQRAEIIGGTNDSGDPAVVALYIVDGAQAFLCSASVVAPTVLLTAAHCVSSKLHSSATKWYAYLGDDVSQATSATLLPVAEVHENPAWDPSDLPGGHDVGIAILASPITVTPLPIRRAAVTDTELGASLRLVGYGATNGATQTGAGLKRQAQTPLDDYDTVTMTFTDPMHLTCNGDSGGPALLVNAGVEEIAGITSYGDGDCTQFGADTRVDAELAFIDPYLPAAPITPDLGEAPTQAASAEPSADLGTSKPTVKNANVYGGCSAGGGAPTGVLVVIAMLLASRRRMIAT